MKWNSSVVGWYLLNAIPILFDIIGMQIYTLKDSPFTHPIWEDQSILDFIFAHFHNIKESKVLDIGCGQGGLALKLGQLGANVEGIDISPHQLMLAKAKKYSLGLKNVRFRLLNATDQLPYPNDCFNIVVLYHVYEHLSKRTTILSNIHRILHQDGKLIIAVPLITALKETIAKFGICGYSHLAHEIEFSYESLLSELITARFNITKTWFYGFDPMIQNLFTPLFAVFPKQVEKINKTMKKRLEPANVICTLEKS